MKEKRRMKKETCYDTQIKKRGEKKQKQGHIDCVRRSDLKQEQVNNSSRKLK